MLAKIWELHDEFTPSVYLCERTQEISGKCIIRGEEMDWWILNPFYEVRFLPCS